MAKKYYCPVCGYESDEPIEICPICKAKMKERYRECNPISFLIVFIFVCKISMNKITIKQTG